MPEIWVQVAMRRGSERDGVSHGRLRFPLHFRATTAHPLRGPTLVGLEQQDTRVSVS
jgi:hypothetical protein